MAAYSNPTLPPKTMMRIYKAATPDGGSNLNVLKFSQVMLENGLSLQTLTLTLTLTLTQP